MKEECLICKASLEYLNGGIEMECAICHKKEISTARRGDGMFPHPLPPLGAEQPTYRQTMPVFREINGKGD